MAALEKFKLLARQCGVAQSPTRSPRTSPGVVLRRRKTTLRMLLSRSRPARHRDMPIPTTTNNSTSTSTSTTKDKRSLRDLFNVSSPPFQLQLQLQHNKKKQAEADHDLKPLGSRTGPGWIGLRNRSLLTKLWRPVLAGIPE